MIFNVLSPDKDSIWYYFIVGVFFFLDWRGEVRISVNCIGQIIFKKKKRCRILKIILLFIELDY